MATYSNIGIKLITTGDESGTWGTSTNTNFSDVLDEAIAGAVTYNISSDADFTLTVSDGTSSDARHAVIKFTSTTLTATRVCTFAPNDLQKTWVVINSTTGGQSLTFKQGSAGGTVTVPNGESAIIYSDGGGSSAGAVTRVLDSFTNTKITTGTLNATTLDLTNLEVTNIKAKDGTSAASIADSTGVISVTASPILSAGTANQVQYLNGSKVLSGSSNLTFDGTTLATTTVDATNVEVNNIKAKDGTAAASIADSTGVISLTSNPTLSGGTANGVLYLNGSKVATSGSALYFDGTNLGVGTTSPSQRLDTTVSSTTEGSGLAVTNAQAGGYGSGAMFYSYRTNGTTKDAAAQIQIIGADTWSSDATVSSHMAFRTVNANVFAERMRITSAGNVGIGTASPVRTLTVYGATDSHIILQNANYNGAINKGFNLVLASGGDCQVWNYQNASLQFATNNTERMRLDSSGNLGIGTTSPATNLSVVGTGITDAGSNGAYQITVDNNAAYNATPQGGIIHRFKYNSSAVLTTGAAIRFYKPNANDNDSSSQIGFLVRSGLNAQSQALTLDSSGNLGLGVTPSAWSGATALQVNNSLSLWSQTSGSARYANNVFFDGSTRKYIFTGTAAEYEQGGASHAWKIAASGTAGNAITFTQAMTLDASGNLGIGTTSPGQRLQISQSETTAYASSSGSVAEPAGGANISIVNTGSGGFASLRFSSLSGSYAQGYLGFTNAGGSVSGHFVFGQRNNTASYVEQMRLDSAGNLGIGTTSPTTKLDVAGNAQVYKSGKGTIIALDTASYAAGVGGTIDLGGNYRATGDYSPFVRIAAEKANATNNDYGYNMGFYVTTNGGSTLGTKALTIDSSGNLGIGTTSPTRQLSISNASQSNIQLTTTGAGGTITDGFQLQFDGSSNYVWGYENVPTLFGTNNAERGRFTAGGQLLIGATSTGPFSSSGGNFYIQASATYPTCAIFRVNANGDYAVRFDNASGTLAGYITVNSGSTTYDSVSDYRLKENVQPMSGALAKINALEPVTYTWKEDGSYGEGFIAHKLQEVIPLAVRGKKDAVNEDGSIEPQGIDPRMIVATLVAAMQEQQTMINELKVKVAVLENK